jgi:hypothetical protein
MQKCGYLQKVKLMRNKNNNGYIKLLWYETNTIILQGCTHQVQEVEKLQNSFKCAS